MIEQHATKRPSFQFYPGDWRGDPDLRLCSIGARGLWIEMMCLMHEGEPYGHLTRHGAPISTDALARWCGESLDDVQRWLEELRTNCVYSVSDDGTVFSRRMVRDEHLRNVRAAGGAKGGEHGRKGADHGKKGGRPKKQKPPLPKNEGGNQKPPKKPSPSSSSSSSSSPSSEEKDSKPVYENMSHTRAHAREDAGPFDGDWS